MQGQSDHKPQPTGNYVFISYAREDQLYVRRLAEKLRQRGFEVWIDDRIDFGDRWWRTIVKAIHDSVAVIVVMTPDSEKSEWVERELLLAQRVKKPVFPLLLRGHEFPLLITTHYADVTNGNLPPDEFYERLGRLVRPQPPSPRPPPILSPGVIYSAIVVMLLLIVIGSGLWFAQQSNSKTTEDLDTAAAAVELAPSGTSTTITTQPASPAPLPTASPIALPSSTPTTSPTSSPTDTLLPTDTSVSTATPSKLPSPTETPIPTSTLTVTSIIPTSTPTPTATPNVFDPFALAEPQMEQQELIEGGYKFTWRWSEHHDLVDILWKYEFRFYQGNKIVATHMISPTQVTTNSDSLLMYILLDSDHPEWKWSPACPNAWVVSPARVDEQGQYVEALLPEDIIFEIRADIIPPGCSGGTTNSNGNGGGGKPPPPD